MKNAFPGYEKPDNISKLLLSSLTAENVACTIAENFFWQRIDEKIFLERILSV